MINVDILIGVAQKGGVENIIKSMTRNISSEKTHFRIVQMVWEEYRWLPEDAEFYPLLKGGVGDNFGLQEFVDAYTSFLKQKKNIPDIILVAGWPYLCRVARIVVNNLKVSPKIISWVHNPIIEYQNSGYGSLEELRYADAHFAINQRIKNEILQIASPNRVFRVNNPVDFPSLETELTTDKPLSYNLFYVGRITHQKKLEVMLQALSKVKKWTLNIVGEGEEEERLKELAMELGIAERVHWLGWQENPWMYAREADALVMSSIYEGFPLTVIEGGSYGLPVISSRVDGVAELIEDGVNGYLYEIGDVKGLIDILCHIEAIGTVVPKRSVCREKVACFESKAALCDMEEKLQTVLFADASDKDKISVIIPCYNVEKQIESCLDSILRQKIESAEFEIICVDDASIDSTVEVLKQYEQKYPEQIMLILLEENGKQGRARNIALEYATGNYITYVDSDDCIAEGMLEDLYLNIKKYSCDIAECGYQKIANLQDMVRNLDNADASIEVLDMQDIAVRKRYVLEHGWETHVWGRLYTKKFLIENNIYFPESIFMEDVYFYELCLFYMKNCVRLSRPYYGYVINQNGTMFSEKIIDYYMDTPIVQNITTKFGKENKLFDTYYPEFQMLHFTKAFAEPVFRMRNDERFFSFENIQSLKQSLYGFFPDIMKNVYLCNDRTEEMEFLRVVLEMDYTEEGFHKFFYGK